MSEFKQSRRPVDPLADIAGVDAVMQRIQEMEKNVTPVDPMKAMVGGAEDSPFKIEGLTPQLAALFKKDSRAHTQREAPLPRPVAQAQAAASPKLAELLEGIRQKSGQYEEVRLPSLSKFYNAGEAPPGGVLHVRAITGKEEEIYYTPRFLKKGTAIPMVFDNCCQEGIAADRWLTVDRTYLLIYLRGISLGTLYQSEVRCPACSHRFESDVDLDNLSVDYCPKDFGPENLSGVLPTTGYKFTFRLPTVGDERQINDYQQRRQREQTGEVADDTFFFQAALLLEEVEGLNDHPSLMQLVSSLPVSDVAHLRNVLNDIPFGVDTRIGEYCPSCGTDFEMQLPMGIDFFFPQRKKARRTRVSRQ